MGKIPILTNIFQMGWNHQPVFYVCEKIHSFGQISSRPKTRPISPPNGGDCRGNPRKFQGYPGWWNIIPFGQIVYKFLNKFGIVKCCPPIKVGNGNILYFNMFPAPDRNKLGKTKILSFEWDFFQVQTAHCFPWICCWRRCVYYIVNHIPIPSMYGIFTYMWLIFMVNVSKYTIHGCYGIIKPPFGEYVLVIFVHAFYA